MKYFVDDKYVDDYIMFSILEEIEFYSGTERKKMLKVKKGNGSMLYGNTWKGFLKYDTNKKKILRAIDPQTPNRYLTKVKAENPELEEIFREYSKKYFPNFKWKQIQMNKNFQCPPHKDSSNVGKSICCAFGEYEGGTLCIDMGGDVIIQVDPRKKPVKFNGSKHPHWVTPHSGGNRYSLVFFTN